MLLYNWLKQTVEHNHDLPVLLLICLYRLLCMWCDWYRLTIRDVCRTKAAGLQNFKTFVDAGWFLDVPNFSGTAANLFTFKTLAQTLQVTYAAEFDKCAPPYHSE